MNDKFDSQKETLVSINHEISLLQQQVKYLLRNEKAAELLDLDVLMNRTHTIYDMICTISVGENNEEQDFDIDPEAFTALFGGMTESEIEQTEEIPEEEIEPDTEGPIGETEEKQTAEENPIREEEPIVEEESVFEVEPALEEKPIFEMGHIAEEESVFEVEPALEEEPNVEKQIQQNEQPLEENNFDYFFRFEDIPLRETESEKVENEEFVETPIHRSLEEDDRIEEIGGKTIHFMEEVPIEDIPEKDRVEGEDLIQDDPFKMPAMEETPSQYGSIFEKDDMSFEINNNETLGERMIDDDNSLNAKFQHTPVNDLKQAIGLNDKFLFVNELFGGSMEKFNKSIENLNDLKTLNGAMIYLNELKIELQWNSSNEAYKKLWAMVAQKFEAQ